MEVENSINKTKFENLPQHLIYHIMNFLPYEEAAKFSVLSKAFRSMWLSFPILHFDYRFFKQHKDQNHSFLSFILKTLHLRCPHHTNKSLQRLFVEYFDTTEFSCSFHIVADVLLNFAMDNKVKEIIFHLPTSNPFNIDSLLRLFSSQFLTVLNLKSFRFPIADSIILCPKLKELVIFFSQGLKTITVSSLSLEKVEISFCTDLQGVELKGKNLLDFRYFGCINEAGILHQCHINLSSCESIKCMTLYCAKVSKQLMEVVTDSLFIYKCDLPENFSIHNTNIKMLEMIKNDNLKKLNLLAPKLEVVLLSRCFNLKEAIVDAPNLLKFDYEGIPQVNPMKILSTKCNTANIKLPQCNIDPLLWFGNMKQFLSFFDHIEDLTITCSKAKDLIFPIEFVENNASLLLDLKHIKVQTEDIPDDQTVRELVESSLWLVHKPLELTFICGTHRVGTLKFEYGKKVNGMKVEERCCSGIPTKCWRHFALKVDIQGFDAFERMNLNNLFDPYTP